MKPRHPPGPWVVDLDGEWFVATALVGPFPFNENAWQWIDQHNHKSFVANATSARQPHHAATTSKGHSTMSNQLTSTVAGAVSPWREAVNDEVGASFGTFLKFIKGEWLLGEDAKKVPTESTFVANLEEYYRGWVRWWDGKPTDHRIGRVADRHIVPDRETLGDFDESKWESEPNGLRRDPWSKTCYIAMRNANDDDAEIICFTSSSDGGRKAVAKLADRYDRHRHKFKAKMPVVQLESESYEHSSYGKILKPKFRVVGWEYWDEETAADPDGALQLQFAAEMEDQIPF